MPDLQARRHRLHGRRKLQQVLKLKYMYVDRSIVRQRGVRHCELQELKV
jgi:hypothetical protein